MTLTPEQVESCRRQFPALARRVDGQPAVFLDGPAGTQVPQRVIDAISSYLVNHNANHEGRFCTSRESDHQLAEAHQAVADLLGADDPDCIVFGPNMTSLTFALSRSLAKTWRSGDEILVTRLDHDANVTPWVMAASDAGATVRHVNIHPEDATLDLEDLRAKLTERTRLVAVCCASNATGSIQPVADICRWAHDAGALAFLDAVHFAPHVLVDVDQLGCDFLVCSAYKFFGPHVGVLWGKRELLEQLTAYKVRPAPDSLPGKWMTGTQNHECIVGAMAAVDYLADLGREVAEHAAPDRRSALRCAYDAISDYERQLVWRLLDGLSSMPNIKVWGITDPGRAAQRCPTLSITHARRTPACMAEQLGERGIFVWDGNYYALSLTQALGLEPEGMLRIGLVHYNTIEEVDRLVEALRDL
jgi:cysteine desulfurase family protein (TIGR01976 family)